MHLFDNLTFSSEGSADGSVTVNTCTVSVS